jgi:hypothetical protein
LPIGFVVIAASIVACYSIKPLPPGATLAAPSPFDGANAGDARQIAGMRLRWCPAGTFTMGSPPSESERRPSEDQVQVMISVPIGEGENPSPSGEEKVLSVVACDGTG